MADSSTNTTASKIVGDVVGQFILKAANKKYVCSSVSIDLGINSIPCATVVIGCGLPLRSTTVSDFQTAEDLLGKVRDKSAAGYENLIECSIYETDVDGNTDNGKEVFRGVVVTGSTQYKTGRPTTRAIQFLCMHSICRLYAKPFSEYVNAHGSELSRYISTAFTMDAKDAQEHSSIFVKKPRLSSEQLVSDAGLTNANSVNLVEIISKLVNGIVTSGSYANVNSMDMHVGDYMYSDYKLRVSMLGDGAAHSFATSLCEYLQQACETMSIYDAIQSTITSNAFMLNIVPKGRSKGFKLSVEPSKVFENKSTLKLSCDYIESVASRYNPIACINTPDAFIVGFSDYVDFGNSITDVSADRQGVYALNDGLRAKIESQLSGSSKALADTDAMFRARRYMAPKWMAPVFATTGSTKEDTAEGALKKKVVPNSHGTKDQEKVNGAANVAPDMNKCAEIANEIAKALFIHLYGSADTSTLALFPSVRFGGTDGLDLEANLGSVIDITFNTTKANETKDASSPINIRGVLSAIHMSYATGDASGIEYTIALSSVRPLTDDSEPEVKCPLYTTTTTTGTDSAATAKSSSLGIGDLASNMSLSLR